MGLHGEGFNEPVPMHVLCWCLSIDSHQVQNKGVGIAYFHMTNLWGTVGSCSWKPLSPTLNMLMTWPCLLTLGMT